MLALQVVRSWNMTSENGCYKEEIDDIARMESEKIATLVLKSAVDAINESRLCRFKFKLEIE